MMKKEYRFVISKAQKIEGMLTNKEAFLLYLLAKQSSGKGAIVEIGSYKGKSTVCLALGTKKASREKVYTVDWHKGWKNAVGGGTLPDFKQNMKKHGVFKYVIPMVMKSEEAARIWAKKKNPIMLLWIDGSHDYKDVRKDFLLWSQYIVEGGVIAFHDTFWNGPYKVVNEYILKSGKFSQISAVDYTIFAIKSKPNNMEKLKNIKMLFLRSMLKYPMRAEHLQPRFINKFIKDVFLNDLPEKIK